MRTLLTSLFAILFCGCTSDVNDIGSNISNSPQEKVTKSPNFSTELDDYLSPKAIASIQKIRDAFNQELVKGTNNKDLARNYAFHAQALRYDFLNQERFSVFPYTRPFHLSELGQAANNSEIFTNSCGFNIKEKNLTINYYCLDVSSAYFDYLAEWGETNAFINQFQKRYRETKTLDQELRQQVILQAIEHLDFSKVDHQLFYMFIQISTIEEQLALRKLQADTPAN